MKKHTLIGASMLKNLGMYQNEPLMETAYQICRWHHERYDGKGYPDGLTGRKFRFLPRWYLWRTFTMLWSVRESIRRPIPMIRRFR